MTFKTSMPQGAGLEEHGTFLALSVGDMESASSGKPHLGGRDGTLPWRSEGTATHPKLQGATRGDWGTGKSLETWGWPCAALTSFRYYEATKNHTLSGNSRTYFAIMEISKVNNFAPQVSSAPFPHLLINLGKRLYPKHPPSVCSWHHLWTSAAQRPVPIACCLPFPPRR